MKSVKQYTLSELADFLQKTHGLEVEIQGDSQCTCTITGLATLQDAESGKLSFLANPAYEKYLAGTQASAVILTPAQADAFAGAALVMSNPYLGFAHLSHLFNTVSGDETGIHPSATVDASADIDASSWIGPGVIVEAGVEIGPGVRIHGNSVIGRDSRVGEDTLLWANVSVYHGVTIGARCILHAGVVLGSDGFGFANTADKWVKIAQLGGVVIGDDVEIGAGTAIDRGALDNTMIHDGVKIDNLVQIAHNVEIGQNTAIAGCVGISGSTRIGSGCTIAGGSGIAGHLEIADNTHIAGMAMITRSLAAGVWSSGGIGTMPVKEWRRNTVRFRQLDDIAKRLKTLEKKAL